MTSGKHLFQGRKGPAGILSAFALLFCLSPLEIGRAQTATGGPKMSEWRTLFDGKSTRGWRGFRNKESPSCWKIEDGAFHRVIKDKNSNEECGDLVTVQQYENFELELEWKISPGGNSGVKYLITEERPVGWEQVYLDMQQQELMKDPERNREALTRLSLSMWTHFPIGFEFQLIDDKGNADARIKRTHLTGALYDILPPTQSPARPVGEFNQARVKVQGTHVEHWINGVKVLEYERNSPELKSAIAGSKFKTMTGFGTNARGHITLQDHQSEVWFRNIRLRELPSK